MTPKVTDTKTSPEHVPQHAGRAVEPSFLEKQQHELDAAKRELMRIQEKVADLQANVNWLELNPRAEKVFKDLLEREIRERDTRDKAALMGAGAERYKYDPPAGEHNVTYPKL